MPIRTTPLVDYLSKPDAYRSCDGALFDTLRRLRTAKSDALTPEDIERGSVLPDNTVFYSVPLSTTTLARAARGVARQQWFDDGCLLTEVCDLIFLDLDTGPLPTSRKAENAGGEEYAAIDEVISLCRRGQSVVSVQFGAPGNVEREPVIARQRLAALSAALMAQGFPEPWGLWWRDRHKVGLIVAPSARHAGALRALGRNSRRMRCGARRSARCNSTAFAILDTARASRPDQLVSNGLRGTGGGLDRFVEAKCVTMCT